MVLRGLHQTTSWYGTVQRPIYVSNITYFFYCSAKYSSLYVVLLVSPVSGRRLLLVQMVRSSQVAVLVHSTPLVYQQPQFYGEDRKSTRVNYFLLW